MKNFKNAFSEILKNPILTPKSNFERDKVEGLTNSGRKVSVVRSFYLGETTLLPEQSISIYIDGTKVYGETSEFNTEEFMQEFNKNFATVQKGIAYKIMDREVEAKNYYKSHIAS